MKSYVVTIYIDAETIADIEEVMHVAANDGTANVKNWIIDEDEDPDSHP